MEERTGISATKCTRTHFDALLRPPDGPRGRALRRRLIIQIVLAFGRRYEEGRGGGEREEEEDGEEKKYGKVLKMIAC